MHLAYGVGVSTLRLDGFFDAKLGKSWAKKAVVKKEVMSPFDTYC